MAPTPEDLETTATALALDVVSRADAEPVERRALKASEPRTFWSGLLLRRLYELDVAVYDPLGEMELVIDRHGTLWSLDDPRNAPAGPEIHKSEAEAVAAVLAILGATPAEFDLEAELVRTREKVFIRVKNRVSRQRWESKFFQKKEEEEPKGPPPDRVEAEVNAATGRVFRLRREPAPLPEKGEGGEEATR